jgi:hypothetical protein
MASDRFNANQKIPFQRGLAFGYFLSRISAVGLSMSDTSPNDSICEFFVMNYFANFKYKNNSHRMSYLLYAYSRNTSCNI